MKTNTALAFFYNKPNKYSINALVGALEIDEYFNDLDIHFFRKEDDLVRELDGIIQGHANVIVGLSFFTTQLWETGQLVRNLRDKYDYRFICVAGGPQPTGDPKHTLELGIDIVVRGEGEETFPHLLKVIDQDGNLSDVKGIAYFNDHREYNFTGRRELIELDKYPPFGVRHGKFGALEITRGCPYVCYFCQTPQLFGTRPRHRSIGEICKYISIMKNRGLKDIRVITPNSFSYGSPDGKTLILEKLEELLQSIRDILQENGKIFFGSFPSEVRPEHVTKETISLVLKYASNNNLVIGGQSGSQRILDLCHRGHTVEDVYKAVELTHGAGLIANVDFIFGLPGENQDDIEKTIKVMSDLIGMGARIHTHTFMPLPQTAFAKAPAGQLDENLRALIKTMVAQDKAYGSWKEQELIAQRISKYLRSGKIKL